MCDPNLLYNTKKVLTHLLASNTGCNTIESLSKDFLEYVGCQIPYYELGYRYLETFLQSIPDTLRVDVITKVVCISYNEENTFQSFHPLSSIQKRLLRIPTQTSPHSTQLTSLPVRSSDQQMTNQAVFDLLAQTDIGNDSVIATSPPVFSDKQNAAKTSKKSLSIEHTSDKIIPDSHLTATVFLSPSNFELNLKSSLPNVEHEDAKNYENDMIQKDLFDSRSCGSEVMNKWEPNTPTLSNDEANYNYIQLTANNKYGVKLESTNIENRMAIGKSYELYISEVNNPYRFWFQFDDDSSQLDDLQHQLNESTTKHIIEKRHMIQGSVKGHLCAALYHKNWHRAEFIDEPEGEKVKVFFVDFGTVSEILLTDVRYLMERFCKLPKLCLRGTLDFIKPTGHRWSREATTYFNELIFNVKLVAGVSEISSKDNCARLYLMDKLKDINVNYVMVVDGHAWPDDPTERYKVHIADVYPTFELLEKGEYPTFAEVGKYLEEGIDVEKMFESNVVDKLNYFTPLSLSDLEPNEIIQKYYREKKQAKENAMKKDSTIFMQFFGHIMNNPFLSGMRYKRVPERKITMVSSGNPFMCDH